MNWEAIGAIGEVGGMVLIGVTLIYLATQIRQNTHSIRTASRQTILGNFYEMNWDMARNAQLRDAARAGLTNFDGLPPGDMTTFFLLQTRYMGNVYNGLLLRKAGHLDLESFGVIADTFLAGLQSPGGSQWWLATRDSAPPLVRDYIEGRLADPSTLPQPITETLPFWRVD